MLSVYPRQDLFRFNLPPDFFKDSIVTKYNNWIQLRDRNIVDVVTAINSTIQGVSLPGFGYVPTTQIQNAGSADAQVEFSTTGSFQKLIASRTFDISFTPVNGFFNYFLMLEHYFYYASDARQDNDREPDMGIDIHDVHFNRLFRINFNKVKFIGLDSIEFNHNKAQSDFVTFLASFSYSDFVLEFDAPEKDPIHKA